MRAAFLLIPVALTLPGGGAEAAKFRFGRVSAPTPVKPTSAPAAREAAGGSAVATPTPQRGGVFFYGSSSQQPATGEPRPAPGQPQGLGFAGAAAAIIPASLAAEPSRGFPPPRMGEASTGDARAPGFKIVN